MSLAELKNRLEQSPVITAVQEHMLSEALSTGAFAVSAGKRELRNV